MLQDLFFILFNEGQNILGLGLNSLEYSFDGILAALCSSPPSCAYCGNGDCHL